MSYNDYFTNFVNQVNQVQAANQMFAQANCVYVNGHVLPGPCPAVTTVSYGNAYIGPQPVYVPAPPVYATTPVYNYHGQRVVFIDGRLHAL